MFFKSEKLTTTIVYDIIDREISEYEIVKRKMEYMQEYKTRDEMQSSIYALEDLKENIKSEVKNYGSCI